MAFAGVNLGTESRESNLSPNAFAAARLFGATILGAIVPNGSRCPSYQ
jgi:hypothetical protein